MFKKDLLALKEFFLLKLYQILRFGSKKFALKFGQGEMFEFGMFSLWCLTNDNTNQNFLSFTKPGMVRLWLRKQQNCLFGSQSDLGQVKLPPFP